MSSSGAINNAWLLGQSSATSLSRILFLHDYNTRVVLLGTVVLGITSGLLGVYLLLRRRALIGDAIAHATLPGVALAFLWTASQGQEKSLIVLLTGAAISGALGGATVLALRHMTRIREDAALGIVLSVFFGGGIALSKLVQSDGNASGLESFIYGKAASMTAEHVQLSVIVGLLVIAVILLLGKELKILCFDTELARSQGWPVLLLDSVLIGMVVAVTIVSLQAIGLILAIALLVIPAASARFWTHSLPAMLAISGTVGAFSCASGTLLSAGFAKLPSGATIVLAACVLFAFSFAFGTQRGVVWRAVRFWQLRREHNFQHLLRAVYELLEDKGKLPTQPSELRSTEPLALAEVCRLRSWSEPWARGLAAKMAAADLVVLDGSNHIQLTPRGVLSALVSVRDHRLLEMYLVEQAEANVNEADREADYLEHALLPEHLAELSGVLDLDKVNPLPASPHHLGGDAKDQS